MCIAIPGKVMAILNENTASVDMGGISRDVNLDLLGGASESLLGKYVLVHVGYAISEISEEEGEETMRLLRLMAGLDTGEADVGEADVGETDAKEADVDRTEFDGPDAGETDPEETEAGPDGQ